MSLRNIWVVEHNTSISPRIFDDWQIFEKKDTRQQARDERLRLLHNNGYTKHKRYVFRVVKYVPE